MSGALAMARVSRNGANAGAGQVVPGAYEALIEYERERYCRRGEVTVIDDREIRVTWVDKDDHLQGFFLWPRHALDLLEAGKTVSVSIGWLESALWKRDRKQDPSTSQPRLPFGRGVRRVRLSLDGQVEPVANLGLGGS